MTTVERVYKEAATLPITDIQALIEKLNRLIRSVRPKTETDAENYLESWGKILEGWTDKEKDSFVADIARNRFTVERELAL